MRVTSEAYATIFWFMTGSAAWNFCKRRPIHFVSFLHLVSLVYAETELQKIRDKTGHGRLTQAISTVLYLRFNRG